MRNVTPESLSEHTAETAVIAHALAVIGNTVYGKSYNADRVASLALFHDAAEVYTGDLPTPVKYFSPRMRASYAEIENNAADVMLSKLPAEIRDAYSVLMKPSEDEADMMRLVKIADKLCAYIKCITEERSGNNEFRSAKRALEETLDKIESEELIYFRKNLLDAFALTIDEM